MANSAFSPRGQPTHGVTDSYVAEGEKISISGHISSPEDLHHANQLLNIVNVELRLRNAKLTASHDELENVFAAVELPLLLVGLDLTIRRFNGTAASLFNLGAFSTGHPLSDAKGAVDPALITVVSRQVIATAAGADVEIQDSAGAWRLLRVRPYRTRSGQVDGAIVAILDIDLLKRNFGEAESANQYKDAFLGTVAHELRTPLQTIHGWVQLAQRHPDMGPEALSRVEEATSLLRVFIADLTDLTRIREQKLNMEMAEIDFATVVASAILITGASSGRHGVSVTLEPDSAPAPILGDRVRLQQVVWNLVSNGIKFTPPGGAIVLRLGTTEQHVSLSVTDTGVGISPEFAPHVFELYRQAAEPGVHRPGLGIGLAIVAQIVQAHGGQVRVDSPGLGQGSTFVVTLPLHVPGAAITTKGSP